MTAAHNKIIAKFQMLDEDLYGTLAGISGFRNVLVHEYEQVDKGIVYDYLQNNIDQFREYKRQVLRFLSAA